MYTKTLLAAAGLLGLASAYTQPTNATWGALLTPNAQDPVTQGQVTKVTWDSSNHATAGVTVSLVLCHGDSSNCVNAPNAIASGLAAGSNSYDWTVPCDLAPGVHNTATGYGMLIIVDQTGEFQYSTQFSVLANPSCGSVTTSSTSSSSSSTAGPSSQWGAWPANSTTSAIPKPTSAPGNYTMTTMKPASGTTLHASTTAVQTATPAVSTPASPTVFHGTASRIGGGAAAAVVAVAAAFFAL